MPKLVSKCGYVKSGGAGGYMKYIATREGVEKLRGLGHATDRQEKLIAELLRELPDAAELFEYADYVSAPTVGNASAFIAAAVDSNAHALKDSGGYMKYIALRPRSEKYGAHGLFGSADRVELPDALAELEQHDGNVWTLIFSLRREDAARLAYDNALAWRELLRANAPSLAEAMRIPAPALRWYAAFHDESHHPHIHMMVWSAEPKHGYLTADGITAMRSKLTNTIFKDELTQLYARKDISYRELTTAAREAMSELVRRMADGVFDSPRIEAMVSELARTLETVRGKKQYGYLPKSAKALVDGIVDELAAHPDVARCYEEWNRVRDELGSCYKTIPRVHNPLSRQKEFRAIKNIVIREAESIRMGTVTFEDERMDDEPEANGESDDKSSPNGRGVYEQAAEYRAAKKSLYDESAPDGEKQAALSALERLAAGGYSNASHLLGKLYRDGIFVLPDAAKAERCFRVSADAGNDCSAYALGKLLLGKERTVEALGWLSQAARQGNQYAQYALGKLLLLGRDIPQDKEAAAYWLGRSAAQGNRYAQFFVERIHSVESPSVLLAATRLLHQLSRVFQDNSAPPANPAGLRIDSKRRRKLMEKKIALGHNPDDHEEINDMTIRR